MKPYLNAVERSIDLHFRSLDYGNVRLNQSLDRSEHNMHQTIWKMKTGVQSTSASEQTHQQWNTRSDLEAQLGGLALQRRQKGGGRVFSKEKHSFFDQDSTEADAEMMGANHGQSNEHGQSHGQSSRTHRRIRSSSLNGSGNQSVRDNRIEYDDNDSDQSADDSDDDIDGTIDYNQDAVERRSSVYLSSRFSQARARRSTVGAQNSHDQAPHKAEEESKSTVDFEDSLDTARAPQRKPNQQIRPKSSPSSRPTHKPGVSVVLPTDLFKSIEEANQTSRLAAEDTHRQFAGMPRASFLQRLRRDREMDAKAAILVESIRQTHEQTLRRLKYNGQVTNRQSGNLFAGVRDKFHSTFGALADLSDEETEEARLARQAINKSRPSSAPPRPILPSEAKAFSRPSSANNQSINQRITRRLPSSFSLPQNENTYIDIMRIIQLPTVKSTNLTTPSIDSPSQPESDVLPSIPIQLELTPVEPTPVIVELVMPINNISVSPLIQRNSIIVNQSISRTLSPAPADRRLSVQSVTSNSRRSSIMQSGDGSDSDSETDRPEPIIVEPASPLPPPISVYAAQRKSHLRSNFITFLAATEPHMWSAEDRQQEKKREVKRRASSIVKHTR